MNMGSAAKNTANILGCRDAECGQPVLCSDKCARPNSDLVDRLREMSQDLKWGSDRNTCASAATEIASLRERVRVLEGHLKTCHCPGGGWNGMPQDLEPTIENCMADGACGCIYGAALSNDKEGPYWPTNFKSG